MNKDVVARKGPSCVMTAPACLLNITRACSQYNLADHHSASSHVRESEYVLGCANIGVDRESMSLALRYIAEESVGMFSALRPEVNLGRWIVTH